MLAELGQALTALVEVGLEGLQAVCTHGSGSALTGHLCGHHLRGQVLALGAQVQQLGLALQAALLGLGLGSAGGGHFGVDHGHA